jgi:hypothetical protein
MTDNDSLRHLLDSPMDDPKRPKESETATGIPGGIWFVGAMLVGGLLVFAGYLVGGREAIPIVADEETTTTTAPVTATGFPAGFAPLDSRFGGRVERVLFSPGGVHVTISTVSTFSIEGESSAFLGGAWDLVLVDGTRISSVDQASDALVPGYLTVRFEPGAYGPDDVDAIQHTALGLPKLEPLDLTVSGVVLPTDGSLTTIQDFGIGYRTADGTEFHVAHLTLSPSGGTLHWTLAGPDDPVARVSLSLLASEASPDAEVFVWLQARTGQEQFFGNFGNMSITHGAWQPSGEVAFNLGSGQSPIPTGVELRLNLYGHVEWLSFSPVSSPPIPVDDAPVSVIE